MTPRKGVAFFEFFKLVTPNPHEMTTHENSSSRPGGAESRFSGQRLVQNNA
jgi:hypothetical protein